MADRAAFTRAPRGGDQPPRSASPQVSPTHPLTIVDITTGIDVDLDACTLGPESARHVLKVVPLGQRSQMRELRARGEATVMRLCACVSYRNGEED